MQSGSQSRDTPGPATLPSLAYRKKYREVTSSNKELTALQQLNDINKDIRALRTKTKKPATKNK